MSRVSSDVRRGPYGRRLGEPSDLLQCADVGSRHDEREQRGLGGRRRTAPQLPIADLNDVESAQIEGVQRSHDAVDESAFEGVNRENLVGYRQSRGDSVMTRRFPSREHETTPGNQRGRERGSFTTSRTESGDAHTRRSRRSEAQKYPPTTPRRPSAPRGRRSLVTFEISSRSTYLSDRSSRRPFGAASRTVTHFASSTSARRRVDGATN